MELVEFLRHSGTSLTLVEDKVWVLAKQTEVRQYDFDLSQHFRTAHPYRISPAPVIARMGPLHNFSDLNEILAAEDLHFVNTVEQYNLATDLTEWFHLLEDLTPRSRWWSSPPRSEAVEQEFAFPVFVKGERQTNRHSAASVVRNSNEFDVLMERWNNDSVLCWQKVVVREFLHLRKVSPTSVTDKVSPSFEFRTFWFNGELIGVGPYWAGFASYDWTSSERETGLACAKEAVARIDVPFLVVDIAQTEDGSWVVIELNEAQECGYAGISPVTLWRSLLDKI